MNSQAAGFTDNVEPVLQMALGLEVCNTISLTQQLRPVR